MMPLRGHKSARRNVRIGAIALLILGAFAIGSAPLVQTAAAQSVAELTKKAAKKVKGKAKAVPGKGMSKATDAFKKGKQVTGKKTAGDKLRMQKGIKDKLTKDKGKLTKDKLDRGKLAKDKLGKGKLAKDKLGKDKLAKDKLGKDKLGKEKAGKNLLTKGKGAKDKAVVGKSKLKLDAKSKVARSPTIRTGRGLFAKAKNAGERGKLRIAHRSEIVAIRQRLPVRILPGLPGFTGVPPPAETRFVSTEMVMHVGPNVSRAAVEAAAARHGMVIVAAQTSAITGGTVYICQVPGGVQVATAVQAMEAENIGVAQPSYVFTINQADNQPTAGAAEQYVIDKLRLAEAHKVATGNEILIAVIDSKIDTKHPDLANAIVEEYSAVGRPEQPHTHGTGMVGAIAAHTRLLGIAPKARILAVHAFSTSARQSPEATTRQILAGIEWAIGKGARIINMSFAGPYDPMIQLAMKNAHDKGVVLIAAAGNMGAKSPPLYPAADPHVIAVTATDVDDQLYSGAVRGPHLAVAAPGVEIMVPAPADDYQYTTGTSVAAAHVSGVAALLLERHPDASAATILEVLTATATKLNPNGRDDRFGWGLVDPAAALEELDNRIADSQVATAKPLPKAQPQKQAAPKGLAPKPASAKGPLPRQQPASVR